MESPEDLRFTHDDEDALAVLARQLGMAIPILQAVADAGENRLQLNRRA